MPAIKLQSFGGMLPGLDELLIPENASTLSRNAWTYSGALAGINQAKVAHTCSLANALMAFRVQGATGNIPDIEDSSWLEFVNPDTDVLVAPVVGDTYRRYYWASSSGPPQYNTLARILAGSPAYTLGIPIPDDPIIASVVGGTIPIETRVYVLTYVSSYGEEGPPSTPASGTGNSDATWNLTLTAPGTAETATRALAKKRVYRTITALTGSTTFFLVDEIDIDALSYADTSKDINLVSGTQLPNTIYSAPPADLAGWVSLPNGMLAGWRQNEIWFSEPYRPHAWPPNYTIAVDFPIVGLGHVGQTLTICTTSYPYVASGIRPDSMILSKMSVNHPCKSRGSIVSAPEGVYYVSPNGLILMSPSGVINLTEKTFTKEAWQQYVGVNSVRAARLGTAYYGFGSASLAAFEPTAFEPTAFETVDTDIDQSKGFMFDPIDARVAFTTLTSTLPVGKTYNDLWSSEVLLVKEGVVYWLDITDTTQPHETFLWRSKKFQLPAKGNLAAAKVFFTVPDTTPAQNADRTTTQPQPTLQTGQYALLRVYQDDTLVQTFELRTSGELIRLPSGRRVEFWQFEIEGRITIKNIQVGSDVKSLRDV